MNDNSGKIQNRVIESKRVMLRRSFFTLYHSINTMEFRTNSDVHGDMTYRDIMYLSIIMFTDDCTVTKLVKLLKISKPAVTVKINSLVERGLVIKQKSPDDSRVNIITVSPATYAIYGQEDRRINLALEMLLKEYSIDDIEKFAEMVNALAHNLTHTELDRNDDDS